MAATDVATNEIDDGDLSSSPWPRRMLLWGVPLVVVAVTVYLYGSAGRYVETDNAYLQQDRVDVAAQVSGTVTAVRAIENERVSPGKPVVYIDDAALRIAVTAAEARVASARTEVAALKAAYREKLGELSVARTTTEIAARDFGRQQQMAARKLISASALDTAARSMEIATGATHVIELQLAQVAARLPGSPDAPTDNFPSVRSALADLDRARLDLGHAQILAPQAGIVSHLPKVGARIDVGRPAFALVTDQRLWIDANFKETDLEWVRPGQDVAVSIDTYANHSWHGRVESISQATGSEFSLLPAQNASGNWVKVVQRIPVRIALSRGPDDPPLRDGMSATVRIDTGPHTRFDRWFGHKG
jgi:membrane fusion protein (multidrug efflux system)